MQKKEGMNALHHTCEVGMFQETDDSADDMEYGCALRGKNFRWSKGG